MTAHMAVSLRACKLKSLQAWGGISKHVGWRPHRLAASLSCCHFCSESTAVRVPLRSPSTFTHDCDPCRKRQCHLRAGARHPPAAALLVAKPLLKVAFAGGCYHCHSLQRLLATGGYLQPGFCLCISAVLTPCLGVSTTCMYMVLCLGVCCSRAGASFAGFAASHVAHSQSMHVLTLALNLRQGMHVLTRAVPHADVVSHMLTWCHTVVPRADTCCHTC
jgi:hypothetical protein